MKKLFIALIVLVLIALGVWHYTKRTEVIEEPTVEENNLSQKYENQVLGFSINFPSIVASSSEGYPDSYKVYEGDRDVKFRIPESMATGTNLSSDSYIAVERLTESEACTADLFLEDKQADALDVEENGVMYSVAAVTDAGAGNRYEETVYALPNSEPCIAVRYLIHYGVFENYEEGTVREFDKQAVISEFDSIRRTLVVN